MTISFNFFHSFVKLTLIVLFFFMKTIRIKCCCLRKFCFMRQKSDIKKPEEKKIVKREKKW